MKRLYKKGKYPTDGAVLRIPVGEIRPNPTQPRRDFSTESLMELAQSIAENGILQPLTVSIEEGVPTLVAGRETASGGTAGRIAGGALRGGAGGSTAAAGAHPHRKPPAAGYELF